MIAREVFIYFIKINYYFLGRRKMNNYACSPPWLGIGQKGILHLLVHLLLSLVSLRFAVVSFNGAFYLSFT